MQILFKSTQIYVIFSLGDDLNGLYFCKIVNGEIPSKKIYEDEKVIAFMDINPNIDGHVLLVPKKHYTDYKELDDEIILHMNKIKKK